MPMFQDVARAWRCCGRNAVPGMASVFVILFCCGGCGKGGPRLADAGGIVKYDGKPLEGAMVTYHSDAGPPATATTDAGGRFVFKTNGDPGAIVGSGPISITAFNQTRPLTDAEMKGGISGNAIKAMRKSKIPEKYGR